MGFPKKISQLPAAGTLKNSDIFVLVNQHDVTSQTTLGEIGASISGSSSTFTGNTSATCINQIWVHSISGCSPIQMGEVVMNQDVTFNGNLYLSPTSNTDVDFENADSVSIPTYVLKNCKGIKSDIVTFQNFADYVGKIVTLASEEGGLKWEVTLQPTLVVTSSVDCCFDNYMLTNCVTSEVYGIVNYEKWNGSSVVGTIITIENDLGVGCYGVTTTCDDYDIDEAIQVVDVYETCAICSATTITYKLTGCDGETVFFTNTDLNDYVGNYINAETIPGQAVTCFYVTEEVGEPEFVVQDPQAIYTVDEGCECCGQNPKWKYSACNDEEDQVVWQNTVLGPLGIYAPPPCVRMSTDDGETWKCYTFIVCVPEEEPTEGITNFEVLEPSECCEGVSCLP